MGAQDRTDAVIARLAAQMHGVVTRERLLAAGVSRRQIARRLERGALIRVHRGVFRVGHAAPSALARYAAAALACGERAALAGGAAAHLHRLASTAPSSVTVLAPTERRVPGVRTIRSRGLTEAEVATTRGIRVTTVPRTLLDLAAHLPVGELSTLFHQAGIRHGTRPHHVEALLARHPKARGIARLRRVLHGDGAELSRLETGLRRLLRREGLPLPQMNRRRDGRLLDCRWPEHGVTVELDSYTFHNSLHSWDRDRAREREAYARGDEFRRFTRVDVFEDPRVMLRVLRELLS